MRPGWSAHIFDDTRWQDRPCQRLADPRNCRELGSLANGPPLPLRHSIRSQPGLLQPRDAPPPLTGARSSLLSKPWLNHYPASPADLDVAPFPSLVQLLDDATDTPRRPRAALTSIGRSTTFGELDLMSRRFAAWLQSAGLRQGRPRRDHDAQPDALRGGADRHAARRRHGRHVNPLYTPRELAHQLKDSGAQTLVAVRSLRAHRRRRAGGRAGAAHRRRRQRHGRRPDGRAAGPAGLRADAAGRRAGARSSQCS